MKINLSDFKNSLVELNKLVSIYENTYLNMYNNIYEIKNNWIGEKSVSFFEKNNFEQKKNINCIEELKSLIVLYNYIINEYSNISYKLFFDKDMKDKIDKCFNDYINIIDKINNIFQDIPNSFMLYIKELNLYFINLKKKIISIKEDYNNICDKIIEIENNISVKISKLNIELIKETDIRNMM